MKFLWFILCHVAIPVCCSQDIAYSMHKYSDHDIDKIFAKDFFITVIEQAPGKPTYSIIRSTLAMGGSSKTLTSNNTTYYVSQSIGQASVIGTYTKKKRTVVQGFQQPILTAKVLGPSENMLSATIYPNPFSYSVNILFHDQVTGNISIVLLDVSGKIVLTKQVAASKQINLLLSDISNGIYVLKVTSGDKTFTAKLLKE